MPDDLSGPLNAQAGNPDGFSYDAAGRTARAASRDAAVAAHSAPKIISHSFGFLPGIDLDRLGQLADALEAEAFADKLQGTDLALPAERGDRWGD